MMTETFIASIQTGPKSAASSSLPKDASIFLHDFQPSSALKGTLKKSSTNANCLAYTATHIFAAQSDKALVNVYDRKKGNLETFVPFPDRITSLVRIGAPDGAAVLAMGTARGALLLWELFTGRLVSTEPSHLQAVTCLAVDPTNTFLLSGSIDSSIQVWSTARLLSFTDQGFGDESQSNRSAPLHHFSNHRGAVTSIITGHSHTNADFAVSASEDRTCLVWNYRTGDVLHMFLVPEVPLCLAIDAVDRGFFAGLSDGRVQFVNFHRAGSSIHLLYDRNLADTPTQAAEADMWSSMTTLGKTLSIAVSYDSTRVLTGHDDGKIFSWEAGVPPLEISDLGQPVSNLIIMPPTGFPSERKDPAGVKQITVVKPRPGAFSYTAGSGLSVPKNYNFSANFAESIPLPECVDRYGNDRLAQDFEAAISSEHFPEDLLQAAILEIESSSLANGASNAEDGLGANSQQGSTELVEQLRAAQNQQRKLAEQLAEASREIEKHDRLARERQRTDGFRNHTGGSKRGNNMRNKGNKQQPGGGDSGSKVDSDVVMSQD